MLCVLDEILKGTNTRERLAASDAILEYIAGTDCFVLVSTHDMELAGRPDYGHYYFESRIVDTDIVFDYRIHEGWAGRRMRLRCLRRSDSRRRLLPRQGGMRGM